ncbi:MAG: PD40 domain-containing protein [Candidatus Eremiobacteraeota bacterium]|nr:PD40 domain-containing protein [Candidatus Eremiobacteraeota bacterium]
MKIQSKYPLLLTLVEKDYLNHHYEDERTSGDVYKALYLQGEEILDDRVVHWKPLSADAGVDEQGIAWKDAHACWIRRDRQSFLVTPGSLPQAEELPAGLSSASGRYQWSVDQGPDQPTRLQQLDRQTGQTAILREYPESTNLDLASDPSSDRLVWSGPGLNCWNPDLQNFCLLNSGLAGETSKPVFSPDGKDLAFVLDQQVYNLSGGSTYPISGPRSDSYNYRQHPSWSPDGKRLFYVDAHYDIEDDTMKESYQWTASTPDGSQRRTLLSRSAVASVKVGPALE